MPHWTDSGYGLCGQFQDQIEAAYEQEAQIDELCSQAPQAEDEDEEACDE